MDVADGPHLAPAGPISGEMHPGQVPRPPGQAVQNRGRHVTSHGLGRHFLSRGDHQPSMDLGQIVVGGEIIGAAADPYELPRSAHPGHLLVAIAQGQQVDGGAQRVHRAIQARRAVFEPTSPAGSVDNPGQAG